MEKSVNSLSLNHWVYIHLSALGHFINQSKMLFTWTPNSKSKFQWKWCSSVSKPRVRSSLDYPKDLFCICICISKSLVIIGLSSASWLTSSVIFLLVWSLFLHHSYFSSSCLPSCLHHPLILDAHVNHTHSYHTAHL